MNLSKFNDATKINVVGLARSGQHGVVNWLFQQFDCSLFLNNYYARPHNSSVYDPVWFMREKMVGVLNGDSGLKPSVLGFGLEGSIDRATASANFSVAVVRDIKNHVASLVKHPTLNPNWDEFFEEWKKYANKALEVSDAHDPKMMLVEFPAWAINRHYRELAASVFSIKSGLFFEYTDSGKESVMASGGGSSFDKQNFDGKASQMDVLNRWRDVKLPPIPKDVLSLNDALYPQIYE